MARKLKQSTSRSAEALGVEALHCRGGARFERHIPVDALQEDIRKANHVVQGDIAAPVTWP
jgi:hypothetical protein